MQAHSKPDFEQSEIKMHFHLNDLPKDIKRIDDKHAFDCCIKSL